MTWSLSSFSSFFTYYTMSQQIPTLKLLLIGNSNVGKSSLLLRFTDDTFLPQEEVSATIGKANTNNTRI
jgi:GTPase SAR1 family protein